MIAPGDIAPRRDTDDELYVAVLSNAFHLAADTGRVITCPFVPGQLPGDTMAMV
ncbi:MAG TPA: toxin, partial [Mycobacterium sp.]|nr:toxin [Mycobacterium sp.]